MSRLLQIVPHSHACLAEVIKPGDLAVDLTAGNGHDTLFLGRSVGKTGRVLAFDLQRQALENTARRLDKDGISSQAIEEPQDEYAPGTYLICSSHDQLFRYLAQPPQAVIANLGYLPGGDKQVVTCPESTLSALQQAADLLAAGGRISVVVYVGHPGGREEGEEVDAWFARLAADEWNVLRMQIANRPESPYLLVAEKK